MKLKPRHNKVREQSYQPAVGEFPGADRLLQDAETNSAKQQSIE